MSAQKYVFKNKALQRAANLGTGVFKPAAAAQSGNAVIAPESLPKPKYPYPDNSLLIEQPGSTRIIMQREGLGLILEDTVLKQTFTLRQLVDPKNKSVHERQLSKEEAVYALILIEDHFGQQECDRLKPTLDVLKANLPVTYFPRMKAKLNAARDAFVFNEYGYEYTVGINGHKLTAGYRDPVKDIFDIRHMRKDEIELARRAISSSMTITQSAQHAGFFEMLRKRQDSYRSGSPAP